MPLPVLELSCPSLAHARAQLQQAHHLLLDLDGTLIRQDEVMAGAAALVERFAGRLCIVSNNSTDTAHSLSARLHRMGLAVAPEHIVLAGEAAVRLVHQRFPGARVMLVGSLALRHLALEQGCLLDDAHADVVLLALDMHFSYERLRAVVQALRRGARLVVANGDLYHPGPDDTVVPETGALLAAVRAASGVDPLFIVGKPEAILLNHGLRRLGARADDTLMIGDNPNTDGAGASRLGMACVLLGTGAQAVARTPADLLALLDAGDAVQSARLSSA